MPNDYFQFKQFKIVQSEAAMKVCTDSCILGAWATPALQHRQLLDIGTGTGLLSLMLAQRTKATITAIEIELAAYQQAKQNISNSPWQTKIQALHTSLQAFVQVAPPATFDFIICNPPFFQHHLPSADAQRNTALHSHQLEPYTLLEAMDTLLKPEGEAVLLYPSYEATRFAELAYTKNWQLHKKFNIFNREGDSKAFRTVQHFSKVKVNSLSTQQLFIRSANHQYHPDFKKLLAPYYLIF